MPGTSGERRGAPPPLRGQGPRVFISYSYADAAEAAVLRADFDAAGMQVRMEDESSLLGTRLADALPRRIADCEVFVSLITPNAAASGWIAREFEWASSADAGA